MIAPPPSLIYWMLTPLLAAFAPLMAALLVAGVDPGSTSDSPPSSIIVDAPAPEVGEP